MENVPIPSILELAVLLWVLVFGMTAARSAAELGRARPMWFLFGGVIGPMALLLLRAAPPARCRTCGTSTRGWLKVCWWCRQSVFGLVTVPAGAVVAAGPGPADHPLQQPEIVRTATPEPSVQERPEAPPDRDGVRVHASTAGTESIRARRRPRTGPTQVITPTPEPQPPPTGDRTLAPADASIANDSRRLLATAVYVAGSTHLQSGHRYGISIRESSLQILGPTEVQPDRVAFDRRLAGLDARAVGGRLIVADGSGLVLAFMAVAGPTTGDLATIISEAGRVDRPG